MFSWNSLSCRVLMIAVASTVVVYPCLVRADAWPERAGYRPGTHRVYLESGLQEDLLHGNLQSWTGLISRTRFRGGHEVINGHTATLVEVYDGPHGPGYFKFDDDGNCYVIAYGDPDLYEWHEYYVDPKLILPAAFEDGETVEFEGTCRGRREDPLGGYQPWIGRYGGEIAKIGEESVTTPLGTFQAEVLEIRESCWNEPETEVISRTESTSTTTLWISGEMGLCKVACVSEVRTDMDKDGEWEAYDQTTCVKQVIGRSAPPGELFRTRAHVPEYPSNGGLTRQAVLDALDAVADGSESAMLGSEHRHGRAGFLAGISQFENAGVRALIAALRADGADEDQAFLRVELEYDEILLAEAGVREGDLAPYWWDDSAEQWVLVGTTTTGEKGAGQLAAMNEHRGLVGYYGIDIDANVVWMNVNHGSHYGLMTVPEPASLSLLGCCIPVLRRRRS